MSSESSIEEAEKNVIRLEVDLDKNKNEALLLRGLQAKLIDGAVRMIVEQLTPERMTEFAHGVLSRALDNFSPWEIQKEIEKLRTPMIVALLQTPEYQERVRAATVQGIERAICEMPEKVREEIIRLALNGIRQGVRDR